MSGRRRRILIGIAAAAIAALAMIVDFTVTEASLDIETPAPCEPVSDEACNDARNQVFDDRLDRAQELESSMETRFWIYSFALVAAALALTAAALRATPREGWREVFTDLGVAGVAWLIAIGLLAFAMDGDFVDAPEPPRYMPMIAMCVVAALGSLGLYLRRSLGDGSEPATTEPGDGRWTAALGGGRWTAARAGLALTVLTIVLVYVSEEGRSECGVVDPGWTDSALWAAIVSAATAALIGVVCLFQRRWLVALICVTVAPFVALFGMLMAACLS